MFACLPCLLVGVIVLRKKQQKSIKLEFVGGEEGGKGRKDNWIHTTY
jgi:hypothetical protein